MLKTVSSLLNYQKKVRRKKSFNKSSLFGKKILDATESTGHNSQLSSKYSSLSMAALPTTTTPLPKQSSPFPTRLSAMLKVEGHSK
jgi:hypothetical protein